MSRLAQTTSPAYLRLVSETSSASSLSETSTMPAAHNHALALAYQRLLDAKAEVAAAEDALEWLADEWRHRWPLAPEEILDGASPTNRDANVERDIVGRCIVRETSSLTKRLSRRTREDNPRLFFSLRTTEDVEDMLQRWRCSKCKGKTEKGSARLAAQRLKYIAQLEREYELALTYETETSRLRELSGVQRYHRRLDAAKSRLAEARRAVFAAPAETPSDLLIKSAALDQEMVSLIKSPVFDGPFGDVGRFLSEVIDVVGRLGA